MLRETRTFKASVRHRPPPGAGVAVIDLHGEINGFAEEALNDAYTQAEGEQPAAILLNFGDVSYINSTGIALIVGLLARARKAHLPVLTCELSEHYEEIFHITRLADFMSIFPDETSALNQLAS